MSCICLRSQFSGAMVTRMLAGNCWTRGRRQTPVLRPLPKPCHVVHANNSLSVTNPFSKAKPMRLITNTDHKCRFMAMMLLQTLLVITGAQISQSQESAGQQSSNQAEQIRVPNRSPNPLFQGKQGKQKTEIHFDPASGMVTMKLLVQDPNGYFIPNIRRENFAVYENGVRQQIDALEI